MNALLRGLAFLFVLIASLRIVSTHRVFNHTIDEPAHFGAGLEWIDGHRYTGEDLHPPLARVFGAVGPHLSGVRWSGETNTYYEGFRQLGHGQHYDDILALGRLGILPFFWLGALVVYRWTLRGAGLAAATIATFLFTTVPPVLAHSGLITTDMALSAGFGVAMLASLRWANKPTLVNSLIFGFCLSIAVLAKFSSLVYLPAAWLLVYGAVLLNAAGMRKTLLADARLRVGPAALVLATTALMIWAAYFFKFARVEYLDMQLPAPAFFTGLRSTWLRNQDSGASYLLGQRSLNGFWYYFPVVLAVKTPLALLLLNALAIWQAWRSKARLDTLVPLACSLGILLVAMTSRLNLGSRHILPVYLGLCVAGGIAASRAWGASRVTGRLLILSLLVWQLASGLIQHPNYLAYGNELVTGHLENVLVDSDLDWGQDMKRLGERLHDEGAREVSMKIFNRGYLLAGHPFPKVIEMPDGDRPPPGWSAISLTAWKLGAAPEWVARIPPREVIGGSIFLYYFPQ